MLERQLNEVIRRGSSMRKCLGDEERAYKSQLLRYMFRLTARWERLTT